MNIHSGITHHELTEHLRELALRGGHRALVDAIDQNLIGTPDGFVTEEDHEKIVKDAEDEAFDRGKAEAMQYAKNELADERDEIERIAFEEGRADAAVFTDRTSQAARVDALIAGINAARDALAVLNGVVPQPGHLTRPAKISELKNGMNKARRALVSALHRYEIPSCADEA